MTDSMTSRSAGNRLHRFANPARFQRLAQAIHPWCLALALLCLAGGLATGLVLSPPDYQQGESVRIMYVHVPAAWMALFVYGAMALSSAAFLVWRHPLAGLAAKASAPIGTAFTFLALATGSLWGKPMWGAWWVWGDTRLTSMLLLLFLYLGYMALANAFEESDRGLKAASVLALVGIVNLPVIKFSVEWWSTLHQPASVLRFGGPSIDPSMLWPLLLMALGYAFLYVVLLLDRLRTDLNLARCAALRRLAAGE